MTRTNRLLNRVFLALVGLVLIAAAAWIGNRAYPLLEIPALPETLSADLLWIIVAACALLIVLSIAWIVTRGRGRQQTVLRVGGDDGSVAIDARVASDLISEDLKSVNDVSSVSATAFRVGREPALEVRVDARRGADLRTVITSVTGSIDELDAVFEKRIPVLLHVRGSSSGVRLTK